MAESEQNFGLDASDYFQKVEKIIVQNRRFTASVEAMAKKFGANSKEMAQALSAVADIDFNEPIAGLDAYTRAVLKTNAAIKETARVARESEIALAKLASKNILAAGLTSAKGKGQTQFGSIPVPDDLSANQAKRDEAALSRRKKFYAEAEVLSGRLVNRLEGEAKAHALVEKTNAETHTRVRTRQLAQLALTKELQVARERGLETFNNQSRRSTQNIQETNKQAERLLITWRNFTRLVEFQILHTAVRAFIAELAEGVRTAQAFQIKISEIRTISQASQQSFAEWSGAVRSLSDQFGNPILDVAKGTYEAISNQVAKGAEAAQFMAKALTFAQVAVTSTENSVNLLSSVINAYKLNVEDTDRISAQLFKTIDLGRVRADDLANTFGRIAPLAAQLGIRLEELNASIALITIQGIKPAEALTSINGIMNQLLKPTEEMKNLFKEWGVSSGQAAINTFGFDGVLRKLLQSLESGQATFEGIIDEIRARRGLTPLIRSLDDYDRILKEIRDGSQQEFINAQKIINESAGKQFSIEINKIKNIFAKDFGQDFLEFFVGLGKTTDEAGNKIKGFADGFRSLITVASTGIATLAAYKLILKEGAIAQVAFNTATALSSFVFLRASTAADAYARSLFLVRQALGSAALASTVATAGIAGIAFLWFKSGEAADAAARKYEQLAGDIQQAVEKATVGFRQQIDEQSAHFKDNLSKRFKVFLAYNAELVKSAQKAAEQQKKYQKDVNNALENTFKIFSKNLQAYITDLENQSQAAVANIEAAQAKLSEIRDNLATKKFNAELKLLPEPAQIDAIFKRIQQLQDAANAKLSEKTLDATVSKKNQEEAEKLFKEADRLTQELVNRRVAADQERLNLQERISEEQNKQVANSGIQEDKRALRELNEQQRQLNAARKRGDSAALQAQQAELRRKIAEAQVAERSRRSEAGVDDLAEALRLQEEILKRTGSQEQLATLINQAEAQREALYRNQVALNEQLLQQAEKKKELEQENLEHLRDIFVQLVDFKLPDIKTPEQLKTAIDEFNELFAKANITDQNILLQVVQKRVELEKQGNLEIELHKQQLQAESLVQQEKVLVEQEANIAALQKKANDEREAGIQKLLKLSEVLISKANSQQIGRGLIPAQWEAPFKELSAAIKVFRQEQSQQAAEGVRKAVDQVSIFMIKESNNLSGILKRNIEKPEGISIAENFGLEVVNLQDVIHQFNEGLRQTLRGRVADVEATKVRADFNAEIAKLGVAIDSTGTAQEVATRALQNFSKALDGVITKLKLIAPPEVEHKYFGGLARGTDTIMTMLSPGEFVVNARQSKKYYNLLKSINSGVGPLYRAEGGIIPQINVMNRSQPRSFINESNISVGDVHVSLQGSGSATTDARAIGRAIQQELRRGTLYERKS